ncbi:MAG: beta-ketoacyl-ACP synthase I [Gammaproteobacteria bacterium]|nr:beta-ketoacyl-ACP synthase I [Gammaproteobacteria bacterium]
MRRVAVTGLGIVSSIGNNVQDVLQSLRFARSGIEFNDDYARRGFRSQVSGTIKLELETTLDTRTRRFMGDGAAYAYIAMQQAIADAGLSTEDVSHERTGLIVGSGGPSTRAIVQAADVARERGARRVGVTQVPKAMCSTCSANLATLFAIRGISYSISSACTTSAHCIGNAAELIQLDKQDIVFAGGGDEMDWTFTVLFDAMGALSKNFNTSPQCASRAFDADRDGFVISGGGGIVVLEEMQHAMARGANIYAELIGYGASSDGAEMVAPSGEGAQRSMQMALRQAGKPVDYVNAHATSTPVGDAQEIAAIRAVFGTDMPFISSTKSLTGHAQGAAGVHEAIYSILMLNEGFICPSVNIDTLATECADANIACAFIEMPTMRCVMSNSFGFGGTNASLVFASV